MSDPSNTPKKRPSKLEVAPRDLPEHVEITEQPFQQLNASSTPSDEPAESGASLIKPRDLPNRDRAVIEDEDATMHEAMRLMLEEGKTREQVARQLKVAPLKLRHWEDAYHEFLQRDLNEGEYHDTDAQLRDLPEHERARFNENWSQVLEKASERRVKVSPLREKLMKHPLTRWFFRNEHGDLDWGVIVGMIVAIAACTFVVSYIKGERTSDIADEEGGVFEPETIGVSHDGTAAGKAVVGFHGTKTWEEKLKYVINPEKVKPLMEKWYTDNPSHVYYDHITFAKDRDIDHNGRHFVILGVQARKAEGSALDVHNFFMAIEKRGDHYLVDWEVSSGYQPMPMKQFMEEKPTDPLEFRLTFSSDDYFNYGFKKDTYFCFKATYLGLDKDDPIYVYGRRDNPDVQELDATLDFQPSIGVISMLKYPPNAPASDQVEMTEVVEMTWIKDDEN